MTSIKHATLGTVTGLQREDGVVQFRGIKYATVTERFADPVLCEEKDIDATKWGPSAPQPEAGFANEQDFIQKGLPAGDLPSADELACTNLNITVPPGTSREGNGVPVLVFVHGGGMFVGTNSWPHYDQAKLVTLAASQGRPIIAININYRLGAAGFLACPSAGLTGNYGIKDVISAFQWIKKHVLGFGGDPNNITAVGNSSGGAILTALLYTEQALFDKIISAGGTALLSPPAPKASQEGVSKALAGILGIDAAVQPSDLANEFRKISIADLVQKTPMMMTGLALDGQVFKDEQSSKSVSQKHSLWCKHLMIGHNEHDGSIFMMGLLNQLDKVGGKFLAYIKQALPDVAEELLGAYKFTYGMPPSDALESMTSLSTDIMFYLPCNYYLGGWPSEDKRYFYRFAVPNVWEGPFQGYASHVLEVAYLFQNYNHLLDEKNKKLAEDLGTAFVKFTYGEGTGHPWKGNTYGREDLAIGQLRTGDTRKQVIQDISDRIGYEKLSGVLQGYLFGGAGA